jgi:general stress protein 26
MHRALLLSLALLASPAIRAAEAELAAAARAVMAMDPNPTLVTLDDVGRPRARTVRVSAPDEDFVLWIATKPNTRKVAQLRADDRVTLHYADDDVAVYVSVMGTATLHHDPATLAAHTFHDDAELAAFWPDYPDDYLLIRVEADWIEVLGGGALPDPETWRPPAFEP